MDELGEGREGKELEEKGEWGRGNGEGFYGVPLDPSTNKPKNFNVCIVVAQIQIYTWPESNTLINH